MDLFSITKVSADLAKDYELNSSEQQILSDRLILMAMTDSLKVRNADCTVLPPPMEIVLDGNEPLVTPIDVNIALVRAGFIFQWKPQKKRGAKRKPDSLRALNDSGELERDVRQAASTVHSKNPLNVNKKTVARELRRSFLQYKEYAVSTLTRRISAQWMSKISG